MTKIQRREMEEGNAKLMKLATLLDSRKKLARSLSYDLEPYAQNQYFYDCGSPGCSLGLWAFMHPETWVVNVFNMKSTDGAPVTARLPLRKDVQKEVMLTETLAFSASTPIQSAMREFSLTHDEAEMIFGGEGCANATNEREAAAFIRQFVAERASYMEVHRIFGSDSVEFILDEVSEFKVGET